MSRKIAEDGWRLARTRLDESTEPDRANIALAEALYWLAVIEDDEKSPDRSTYYAQRLASQDGQVVAGLIFARNFITHQLLLPMSRETLLGGWGTSMFGIGVIDDWRWKSLADLGNPIEREHKTHLLYESFVAGQDPATPLDAAARFFGL